MIHPLTNGEGPCSVPNMGSHDALLLTAAIDWSNTELPVGRGKEVQNEVSVFAQSEKSIMKRKSFGRRGLFLAGLVVAVIIFIFVVSEFNLADRFGKTEQTKNFSNENSSKIDKETGNSADRATQASSEKPVEQGEANAASTNQTSTVKPGETSETAGNTSEETGKQIAGNSSETHPAGTEPGKEEDTGPVVQPEQAIAISGTQTGGNSETAVAPTAVKPPQEGAGLLLLGI